MRPLLFAAAALLLACSGQPGSGTSGSTSSASSSRSSGASSGGTSGGTSGGSSGSSCAGEPCDDGGGCCAGTYCWPFTGTCLADDVCQGGAAAPGQCSCDGILSAPCPSGQSCPEPAHGHDGYCCDNAATACTQDSDCCSGLLCTLDGGACADLGAIGTVAVGGACLADGQCVNDLCAQGACTCLPTGTPFPTNGNVQNCCSESAGLLPDGGQGCG